MSEGVALKEIAVAEKTTLFFFWRVGNVVGCATRRIERRMNE